MSHWKYDILKYTTERVALFIQHQYFITCSKYGTKGIRLFIIILMGTNQGPQDLYKQYMSSCFVPKGPYVSGLLLLKY